MDRVKVGEWLGRTQVIQGVIPSKSNSYRTTKHGGFYKSTKAKDYEKSFWAQCDVYRNKGINDKFSIEVDVYLKNPLQDLDGVFKILLDSLQSCGAIMNDKLCYRIVANKYIDSVNPRIEFSLHLHSIKISEY